MTLGLKYILELDPSTKDTRLEHLDYKRYQLDPRTKIVELDHLTTRDTRVNPRNRDTRVQRCRNHSYVATR